MKLGARIVKTGIAIVLALFISNLLHAPSPVMAGIAAIFAIQPTIYRSYQSIRDQVQGNLIGALTAIVFVLLLGNHIVVIGLAAIIVITLNLRFKLENTIGLSLVTLVSIMESPGDQFLEFAAIRFGTIMLGVFSAFVVNLVFLPPRYENKLYYRISGATDDIIRWIRLTSRNASDHNLLKNEIERLHDTKVKMDLLYTMYREERRYFKRDEAVKARKLVIYRQMISTARRALETLIRLHRYENEYRLLPETYQTAIQEQLDCLITQHEQTMLKYIGKVRPESALEHPVPCLDKKEIIHLFISRQNEYEDEGEDDNHLYHTMQIFSSILAYGEYVEHLEMLVTSFLSYHQEDNEVQIEEQTED
ncbi:aromatic acid exporter family protein [Neobacillus notoginsengisoli]|uniref:Aromatic acid exporter family protein n=1 Tax=Neobacillus notoginsengisoli TaxID=1578198 RepID=A0A417YJP4_9BACI|nr:aromatic acid exporter family protein [Neobacillus notoginsengisoli]RHW33337.1 aromatic acid exporter family protein [Neobacillus notoginsengisoli]